MTPRIRRKPLESVRHAVVGLGSIGRVHTKAAATSPHADLVAVADPDEEARDWAKRRFGVPTFADHRALLEAGIAEAVTLAIPHRAKDEAAVECLKAGLHVYVEKPLAIRIGVARTLVETAAEHHVCLTVGHQYRTFQTPQTIKRLVDAGTFGPVMDVLWTWHQFRPNSYFEHKPWQQSLSEAGGGLLSLQLAHDLDLLVWLLGAPSRVSAVVRDGLHGKGSEDAASAIIEFAGGATVTVQASINRPPVHVVRQFVGERAMLVLPAAAGLVADEAEELLLGTFTPSLGAALSHLEGSHAQPDIRWSRVKPARSVGVEPRWKRPRRVWRRLGHYQHRPGVAAVLDSFFRQIRGGAESLATGQSTLPSVELRNGMVVSSVAGRRVDLPLDAGEVDRVYESIEQGGRLS